MKIYEDHEKIILGFILKDPSLLSEALAFGINSLHFSKYSDIWEVILKLDSEGAVFDFSTLSKVLPNRSSDLLDIIGSAPISLNFKFFLENIKLDHWCKTNAIEISKIARELSVCNSQTKKDEVLAKLSAILKTSEDFTIEENCTKNLVIKLSDSIEKRVIDFKNKKTRGISTGIKALDSMIQGFCAGRYYILGARTSLGKTTLAINFVNSALKEKRKVLFFTVEMLNTEILEKFISLRSRVISSKLFRGDLSDLELDVILAELSALTTDNLFIIHNFSRSIEKIEAIAKYLYAKNLLDFLVVDYVGLIKVTGEKYQSKNLEMGEISGRLKQIALNLNIPVLCLAQLNRDAVSDTRPDLHNLRDSGSLEQDADTVIFIHDEKDALSNEIQKWLLVRKNRWGSRGDIKILTDLSRSSFYD